MVLARVEIGVFGDRERQQHLHLIHRDQVFGGLVLIRRALRQQRLQFGADGGPHFGPRRHEVVEVGEEEQVLPVRRGQQAVFFKPAQVQHLIADGDAAAEDVFVVFRLKGAIGQVVQRKVPGGVVCGFDPGFYQGHGGSVHLVCVQR